MRFKAKPKLDSSYPRQVVRFALLPTHIPAARCWVWLEKYTTTLEYYKGAFEPHAWVRDVIDAEADGQ
jgi:hypothetical protein